MSRVGHGCSGEEDTLKFDSSLKFVFVPSPLLSFLLPPPPSVFPSSALFLFLSFRGAVHIMLRPVAAVVQDPVLLFHLPFLNPVFVTSLSLNKDVKGLFIDGSSQKSHL